MPTAILNIAPLASIQTALQAVVFIGVGIFVIWLISATTHETGGRSRARSPLASASERIGASVRLPGVMNAQPSPSTGPLTLRAYGQALYDSVVDDNRRLFWSRSTVISGIQWVIVCGPTDYYAICSELDVLVGDLQQCFSDKAASKKLVFDGQLEIVQVLCRHSQRNGNPVLMTYARARSLELLEQSAQLAPDERVPENELVDIEARGGSRRAEHSMPVMTGPRRTPATVGAFDGANEHRAQGRPTATATPTDVGAWDIRGTSPAHPSHDAPHAFQEAATDPFDFTSHWMELIAAPDGTPPVEAFSVEAGDRVGRDALHGPRQIVCGKVSATHVEFVHDGTGLAVVDCDSRNGLWVGGQRVARHSLRDDDEISLGRHVRLRYHAPLLDSFERTDDDA